VIINRNGRQKKYGQLVHNLLYFHFSLFVFYWCFFRNRS